MKKLITKFVYLVLLTTLFTSCEESNIYPHHTICEGKHMIVYMASKSTNSEYKHGKYKYAITDATSKGWTLFSNKKYNIGDTIYISK